ncbi:hypothetical protein CGCS363_v012201 [Colletotrichum siamense]|uniref:uncharacterized protein n=1 Tax=Colletotrichum siamense TaxID=690259 RepID=UPI001872C964|nr:uncharacterized protein CGCS363_v012201 [Colletotrichum siamense]KAF5489915.1 hypothetical protein CGCS363_v012201 [Colletotrichum siamense]
MTERPSEFRQRGETTDKWLDRLRRVDPDAGDDVDGFSKMMAEIERDCLAQYRDVLMFWVSRSYRLRDKDGPRSHEVSNEVTEVVQHLEAKHGITRRSQSIAEKSYVDIVELRQMVDEGMKAVDGKNIIGR